jgi:hypothetical protein
MILIIIRDIAPFLFVLLCSTQQQVVSFSASWWSRDRAGLFKTMPEHIQIIEHANTEHVFHREQQRRAPQLINTSKIFHPTPQPNVSGATVLGGLGLVDLYLSMHTWFQL